MLPAACITCVHHMGLKSMCKCVATLKLRGQISRRTSKPTAAGQAEPARRQLRGPASSGWLSGAVKRQADVDTVMACSSRCGFGTHQARALRHGTGGRACTCASISSAHTSATTCALLPCTQQNIMQVVA